MLENYISNNNSFHDILRCYNGDNKEQYDKCIRLPKV